MSRRRVLAGGTTLAASVLMPGARPLAASKGLILAFILQENPEKLLGDIEVISQFIPAAPAADS